MIFFLIKANDKILTDGHTGRQMDIQADRWTWLVHNPELHIVPNTGSSTVFGQVHNALSQTNS